jgi:transcription elongation factor GreA
VLITRKGLRKLRQDLEAAYARRAELAKEAGHQNEAGGDSWHDNFGWDETQRDIGLNAGNITMLEEMLANAQLIDDLPRGETITHGSEIVVCWPDSDPETFVIVGQYEVEPDSGLVSAESPLGQAVMGKTPGSTVTVVNASVQILSEKKWEGLESPSS